MEALHLKCSCVLLEQSTKAMKLFPNLLILTAATLLAADPSPVKMTKRAAPDKALVFEVLVPASRSEVWQTFSTSKGLETWLGPNAVVDLKPGGAWTVAFPGGSTGGGNILSFVAGEELVLAAMAPDKFPTVRSERTRAAFRFESSGNSTIVRLEQTGWKSGPEWDAAYEYLSSGNMQLLEALRQRFLTGPMDWAKIFPTTRKEEHR